MSKIIIIIIIGRKYIHGRFKRLTSDFSREKTWMWLRKGNLLRETEFLPIAAQNNDIRTNHVKARIDKTQKNCRCMLCSDRDERINHILSESSKLAQKEYKTRYDWVDKVIHWELCKKFKFDHTNTWYIHNLASVQENETHKLNWDFEIQADYLISIRRPVLIITLPPPPTTKENLSNWRFCCLAVHRLKVKKVNRRFTTWTLLGNWKTVKDESNGYTNCRWCSRYGHQKIGTRTGGLGNKRTSGDSLNYSIVEIGQNTEKSPRDLRRLAVAQTPVKDHRERLIWETLTE